jgi:TorA maturation chaperone TorD
MQTIELDTESTATHLARECLYRFMAAALSDPYAGTWRFVLDPQNQALAAQAATLLRANAAEMPVELGRGELSHTFLDLEPVLHELQQSAQALQSDYDRIFGLVVARECPPYETEYYPTSEIFFRSQQLADIAGFYRAFGLEPAHHRPERPDFIALELEFMAFLLMKKRLAMETLRDRPHDYQFEAGDLSGIDHAKICEDAARNFFRDHLAWWIPAFASGLRRKAASGFYSTVANVLAAIVPAERGWLGISPATRPAQPELIEQPEEQTGCAACPLAM